MARLRVGRLHEHGSKGRIGGSPKVKRERDTDAKIIRGMCAGGDSYNEIAEELGRPKADIYRVCIALGCAPDQAATIVSFG